MTLAHHGVLTRHGVLMAYILTHLLWAVLPPTDTVYMIWRVMCGSGVMTGIRALITVPVHRRIRQVRLQAFGLLFAAAVGAASPTTAVSLTAATTRTAGTSPAGSVFPWT